MDNRFATAVRGSAHQRNQRQHQQEQRGQQPVGLIEREHSRLPFHHGENGRVSAAVCSHRVGAARQKQSAQHRHGDFDYVDLKEDTTFPGVPKDFGGVSGGGLWRVQVFGSPGNAEIRRKWSLEGVAFYQLKISDSQMVIRCHGQDNIRAAMKVVPRV